MPICRLQKNHALSCRGGPSPALSPHPSPTPNDASKAKQRKVYTPEERALSRFSLSFSSFHPFLFLLFALSSFTSTGPVSFALFLSSSSHASTRPYGFLRSLALDARLLVPPIRSHCLCLSLYPTHRPPIFYSFSLSSTRLARSLTCAQMKSIKMLGATSRQSCSTPTPSFPFTLSGPPFPAALRSNLRQTPTPSL